MKKNNFWVIDLDCVSFMTAQLLSEKSRHFFVFFSQLLFALRLGPHSTCFIGHFRALSAFLGSFRPPASVRDDGYRRHVWVKCNSQDRPGKMGLDFELEEVLCHRDDMVFSLKKTKNSLQLNKPARLVWIVMKTKWLKEMSGRNRKGQFLCGGFGRNRVWRGQEVTAKN